MKVAFVSKLYPPHPGGLERHVQWLAKALLHSNPHLEAQVITGQKRRGILKEEYDGRVFVQRATTIAHVSSTPITLGFTGLLRDAAADLYHFHFPYPWGELAEVGARLKAPIIVTFHMDIVRQKVLLWLYRPFLNRFLERAERIIVWSPQLAASSPFLTHHKKRLVIIPGGIETQKFQPTDHSRLRASQLRASLAGDQRMILFVGRFVYYKGLEYLIAAMKQVPGVLVLVGEGPLQKPLTDLAQALGLAERVKFAGLVEDEELPVYYQASDVFVLPSSANTEAYGLVQVEAHASGIPVVSTDLPTGVKFVNQHGQTGLVVPPRNAQALAAALNRLLEDDELRTRLGKQAQHRAIRQFDISACAETTLQLYREVLSG